MGHLQEEVIRACQTLGVPYTALDKVATQEIWKEVVAQFGRRGDRAFWERLNEDSESVQDTKVWMQLSTWLQGQTILLLFEEWDNDNGLRLQGNTLTDVIGECFLFVFYLTNPTYDFLLCYNDHDFCIALGTATEWIVRYKDFKP